MQQRVGIISLSGTLLVVLVVLFLLSSSRKKEESHAAKHRIYGVRTWYLAGLIGLIAILLIITLQKVPYQTIRSPKPDLKVAVLAFQWGWEMAQGDFAQSLDDFSGVNEITVPVNKNIVFSVTSRDVNHNFAIYNQQGVLLAETQAMPGYFNNLEYRFQKKGDYRILCLEYCGVGHSVMVATVHVN